MNSNCFRILDAFFLNSTDKVLINFIAIFFFNNTKSEPKYVYFNAEGGIAISVEICG